MTVVPLRPPASSAAANGPETFGVVDPLAKDLLINLTSFFQDHEVFEQMADAIIPDLIREHNAGRPLRIWVAGCNTGEETYSLAMLLLEQIGEAGHVIKLQMFASDADANDVARAREGHYPETIVDNISAARLSRFFSKVDHGYRVSGELRTAVVFTTQDVLAEPPFAQLDLVSWRNQLTYLQPEAQAKLMSLFHLALRQDGILVLGRTETIGAEGRFEAISKRERLYRRVGPGRTDGLTLLRGCGEGAGLAPNIAAGRRLPRQTALAELVRRLVLETYAPAAILINPAHECLFSLGPTDRYLRVASGHPTHDLLEMARPDLRAHLRSAIGQAQERRARAVVTGQINESGQPVSFTIEVQPLEEQGEELLLVCFTEAMKQEASAFPAATQNHPRIAELERELDATRMELQGTIRDLELSGEKQMIINEELTALNSELLETLERKRTTADYLQNVLYSTNVATLFLDLELKIRFFTPATKSLFSVIAGDIGRPLIDLKSRVSDDTLDADARDVLHTLEPIEKEIEATGGVWFRRRILPYRTHDDRVEGLVITFTDITSRKIVSKALEAAKKDAEMANVAKSRFLAAASHDLRQPLQTLSLLQGLLAKTVHGERAQGLVSRLDETLSATTVMLNALLDVDQIESGLVSARVVGFNIADLLARMSEGFVYQAQSKELAFHVVPCSLSVLSDPRLLEQMIRNLISNALKYTRQGKVLVGCRRLREALRIEVWDTGIGIPIGEIDAIFEEYRQLDNPAHGRGRGVGLGLSIVRRLGTLLGHEVTVRSRAGKGSVFAVEVPLRPDRKEMDARPLGTEMADMSADAQQRRGTILVVEDDPDLRDLAELLLRREGHQVIKAADGAAAIDLLADKAIAPDLLLSDYDLPGEMNGLQLAVRLKETLGREIPVIILTGNISADLARQVALRHCKQVSKPVKQQELMRTIQQLLRPAHIPSQIHAQPNAARASDTRQATIFVVDDDAHIRDGIREVLERNGNTVETFATGEAFLDVYASSREGCLLIDAYLPGLGGTELLQRLRIAGHQLPAIMITGSSDVPMAVEAMKAGATDFIEKPVGDVELLASIERALERSRDSTKISALRGTAAKHIAELTPRQREIMTLVLAGHPSKNIAADLHISQRTVENHRAEIMRKTGSSSLPALTRLALDATWNNTDRASGDAMVNGRSNQVPTEAGPTDSRG